MTTPAAANLYLAQHLLEQEGKKYAVFNPHKKPDNELPVIFGFNNGGSPGWYHAQLVTEDGEGIGSHICSAEGYMPYDLGILEDSRPDRHEDFKKHYPDGYRMAWVPSSEFKTCEPLQKAIELARQRYELEKSKESHES